MEVDAVERWPMRPVRRSRAMAASHAEPDGAHAVAVTAGASPGRFPLPFKRVQLAHSDMTSGKA